ncbi:MAG: response regulator transcription factor, partial [Coriobacteriaceae bacterium]|nr:response regulator transcription factor [Coriobacteriaceae bacterium]
MTEKTTRILLVDDEESITDFVGYALRKEGFVVDIAANGLEAFEQSANTAYDLFILDIMLPGIDGYELCRRIRAHSQAPILFLSARGKELDKVIGLEIGGDDYLTKPFGVRELLARIRALLRRSSFDGRHEPDQLTISGVTLDEDAHLALGQNGPIRLTPREFELLAYLMKNAGKVLGREELLREAWGWEYLTESKTVDTHIKRLRDKLAEAG